MTRKILVAASAVCFSACSAAVQAQQAGQQVPVQAQQQPAQGGQVRIPIVNPQQAVAQGDATVRQAPWEPLSPQLEQYVDTVLNVWEKRTEGIKTYECELHRWQFDPTFYKEGHSTHGEGTLRFEAPGKAEFKIDTLRTLTNKQPAKYEVLQNEPHGPHWICDGQWVHIMDQNKKKATKIELPPEYRGERVYRSPLPFVFGVKAAEMKARYWIRPMDMKRPGEVWLEAVPRRADDAANYMKVQIVLDQQDTLPKGLIVFMTNWTPQSPHREVFQFNNRRTNMVKANLMQIFRQSFIQPKLGNEWTIDEQPYTPPEAPQPRVATPQMQPRIQR